MDPSNYNGPITPDINPGNELSASAKPKKSKFVLFLVIFSVLLFIGAGLFYYFYIYRTNMIAKQYLIREAGSFKNVTERMNDLNSEEMVYKSDPNKEKNWPIIIRNFGNEVENIEKAQKSLEKAKKNQVKPNSKVNDIDTRLNDLYRELDELLSEYEAYQTYKYEDSKIYYDYHDDQAKENILIALDANLPVEERVKAAKTYYEKSTGYTDELAKMNFPEGLIEYHEKCVEYNAEFNKLFLEFIKALEAGEKGQDELDAIDEFFQGDASWLDEIEELYYEGLHKKFEEAREKAYEIKTIMTERKTDLGVNILEIEIESW
ncbi:MAG: hypothetical protein GF347_01110 [Candidatus Moranbacteria bacterium]|nr:hypothetical protein [Candidatus Moranbacteria bacterium]